LPTSRDLPPIFERAKDGSKSAPPNSDGAMIIHAISAFKTYLRLEHVGWHER